ncbi:hypothetical protein WJX72_007289 [[Myrmecia] bisecta]|uniref:Uncharacterized protein n=1 Tax=[Myrmecia] bisecta TaxID=41462 RepID=A0AAW1PBR8_9CHLO
MNAEAARLVKERKADIEQLGLDQYRQQALKHLKIKTVVKESHGTPIHQLLFNFMDPAMHNLFATVGKDQATVYDDVHMGDYVGVVVHFVNESTAHAKGGDLLACAWLNTTGWTVHPQGDACLAVAGASDEIAIISVVEARVIKLLKGPPRDPGAKPADKDPIVELCSCPGRPGLLASLSKQGTARLWDVPSQKLLAVYDNTGAACLALHPDGTSLWTGGKKGNKAVLYSYEAPSQPQADLCTSDSLRKGKGVSPSRQEVEMGGGSHGDSTIDCMRFVEGERLVTKSSDGRMFVWDCARNTQLATWKVPACNAIGGQSSRCQFGTTADGQYVCAGNSTGDVYVYSASTGQRIAHVSPVKVSAPVRACGLSDDCRHLGAVLGNGFVFRYEYIKPEEKPEEAAASEMEPEAETEPDTDAADTEPDA